MLHNRLHNRLHNEISDKSLRKNLDISIVAIKHKYKDFFVKVLLQL